MTQDIGKRTTTQPMTQDRVYRKEDKDTGHSDSPTTQDKGKRTKTQVIVQCHRT